MISSPRLPHPLYRATAIVIVPPQSATTHAADRSESPEACAKKAIHAAQRTAHTAADRQRFATKGSA
jgi:hypothetical protein